MSWLSNVPLKNTVHRIFFLNSNQECLGTKIETNGMKEFRYSSYTETFNQVVQLCSFLNNLPKRSVVGIYASNSPKFLISDISCILSDYISVGLHLSWIPSTLAEIIISTHMKCIILDESQLKVLQNLEPSVLASIQQIIILDAAVAPKYSKLPHHIKINTWHNVSNESDESLNQNCKIWKSEPSAYNLEPEDASETCSIMFTSGSTGKPKGVEISKKRWKRDFANFPFAGCSSPVTILNHMSLAHGADRGLCWQMLHAGGRIAFSNPQTHEELMQNLTIAKPTFFLAFPHFWSRVHSDYIKTLSLRVYEKLEQYHNNPQEINKDLFLRFLECSPLLHSFANLFNISDELIEEIREKWFGGRIFTPVTGGGHTSETVLRWMTEVFAPKTTSGSEQGSRVQNAYGATEFPGISVNGVISDSILLELIDVPEMNYYKTDKPFPRGEIKVRYKDPEIRVKYWNDESPLDKQGWYHTGDIGMLNTKIRDEFDHPILHIIDRKKNLLEIYVAGDSVWVAVEKLEKNIFSLSPLVYQICLVADRNSPGLIAIVVPNDDATTETELMNSFKELGNQQNLQFFEFPLAIIIRKNVWNQSNGCVSSSGKLLRGPIRAQNQERIEELYAIIERGQMPTQSNSDGIKSIQIYAEKLLETIQANHNILENIPQNTSCVDFLDFSFIGPTEEVTNKLNRYLSLMIEDVKAIRNESATWRQESAQNVEIATTRTNKQVQELNKQISEQVKKTIKLINQSDYQETNSAIHKLSQLFSHRLCFFAVLYHELKEIESLQHPRHKEVTERYGRTLQECMKFADRNSVRVPYQIWASGWWKAPGSTEDPANMLTTPLGTAEVYCAISGERIEKDVSETGRERWHCIDLCNIDHSLESHQQMKQLRTAIRNRFSGSLKAVTEALHLLEQIDPNENYQWILENAHFWHLRTSIDAEEEISPGEFFHNACRSFANRPALGIPDPDKIANSLVPKHSSPFAETMKMKFSQENGYLWLSYSQVYKLAYSVAQILLTIPGIKNGATVGICGFNNIEWAICDFACSLIGCVSVGLHTTNNDKLCTSVIKTAKIVSVICTAERMRKTPASTADVSFSAQNVIPLCESVQSLLVLDCSLSELPATLADEFSGVKFSSLVDELASVSLCDSVLPDPCSFDIDELATILFTSGSSGTPKGVMVTRRSFYNDISQRVFVEPLITPSYIPLSHSSDRMKMWEFLGNGGRVGFAYYGAVNWIQHEREKKSSAIEVNTRNSNNVEQLFAQVELLRPTAMSCPPRIWTGLYSLYHSMILQEDQEIVAKKIKSMFGDRIQFLITGGGPTPQNIFDFFRKLFVGVSFCDSYGATECGAITSNGYPISSKGVCVRLDPLESLKIKGDDKNDEIGNVGEIVVQSPNMSSGYFGAEEQTKEVFIDGWYHTGDIGERISHDKFRVLGRVSSAISRSGKVIFLGALEALFDTCLAVSQICIHYSKTNDELTAIIVPSNPNAKSVQSDFLAFVNQLKLSEVECPMKVVISQPWTLENGMLTAQLKIARKSIITSLLPPEDQ